LCHPYRSWEFHDGIKYQCPGVTVPKCRRFWRALVHQPKFPKRPRFMNESYSPLLGGQAKIRHNQLTPSQKPWLFTPIPQGSRKRRIVFDPERTALPTVTRETPWGGAQHKPMGFFRWVVFVEKTEGRYNEPWRPSPCAFQVRVAGWGHLNSP